MAARYARATLLLAVSVLSISRAFAKDDEPSCADLIGGLRIKSGIDYDTAAAKLRSKGWRQTSTTTQNIGAWTKGGRAISVTLNLGSGTSVTTVGAVRCRN
ncbi:hypothetical protein MKK69_22390 [Methylobacterium sp. J-026]|uniref:hypothetical protein n=1 Tax=Methylobacterium sp. J-026 TaxID=2836624 RepID=UPI001FBBB4F7|nr:hypothetical protein [Methylobacterium sp. J-026]MCJ2136763.1 hypothetical protein [Methylobacterium sp. J-026]